MEFSEVIRKRYSLRDYTDQEVEREKLDAILEAGRIAPTAANTQSQRIYVMEGTKLERLCKYTNLHGAKLALIVCGNHEEAWVSRYDKKDSATIDASIVCTHMMLEATSLGLGSLWVCSFDPKGVHDEFDMGESIEPINILCLGYPKGVGASSTRFDETRKKIEEIVVF
ncbi:MAG: nitroreductase family protein [Longicatena sp.]